MGTNRVWAVGSVRDEEDIIEPIIRNLFAQGIDGAIVSDNLSKDKTRKILARLTKEFNLMLIADNEEAFYWYQGNRTGKLAQAAHDLGAEWIIPFDADEMFYATSGTVADELREAKADVLSVPMLNYFATGQDNRKDSNPLTREQWRKRGTNPLNKVVFRWQAGIEIEPGNHHVWNNGRGLVEETNHSIEIAHFQNRSPEHLIRKIRNEAAGMVIPTNGHDIGYWHKFHKMTDDEIEAWWWKEYFFMHPSEMGLIHDPAPYRELQKVKA